MSTIDRLRDIIEPLVADLGLELFDLEYTGSAVIITIDRSPDTARYDASASARATVDALDAAAVDLEPDGFDDDDAADGDVEVDDDPAHGDAEDGDAEDAAEAAASDPEPEPDPGFVRHVHPGVDLGDITRVSRAVSRALDEQDPVPGAFTLEVSSPGLERPLRTEAHFAWAIGQKVQIKTVPGFAAGRRLTGTLVSVGEPGIVIQFDEAGPDGCRIAFDEIEKARTVFEWGPESRPNPSSPSRGPSSPKGPKSTKKSKSTAKAKARSESEAAGTTPSTTSKSKPEPKQKKVTAS